MQCKSKIQIALAQPYDKSQELVKSIGVIGDMELCSIYDPQCSLRTINIGSKVVPVFQELQLFLNKAPFDVLIDGIGIPDLCEILSTLGKDKVSIVSKDQLSFFKPFLKKLNEAIRINKQSEAIMEAAQEGIQVVDANGKILYANSSFVRITKVPLEERINKNVFDVSPDGSLAEVLRTGRAVFGNTHVTNGTPIIANASPLITDGKLTGAVTVFSDASSVERLARIVKHSREQVASLKDAIDQMNQAKYSLNDLIGESRVFTKCIDQAKMAAEVNSTVLITGESGTGKELFAHGIHESGVRAKGPFIKVNCPAIPANLIESELFGYEKGAFTGANKLKIGKFELANGGTIFLDEIGDMDFTLQSKLLRVLQEREFERIGGTHPIKTNVRIIAATNKDLQELVEKGLFRKDLFYRLNVVHIHVPPLRNRREDIPLLVNHMLDKFYRKTVTYDQKNTSKIKLPQMDKEALNVLCNYDWPGNVRELENIIEKVSIFNRSNLITREDIAFCLDSKLTLPSVKTGSLSIKAMEKRLILSAIDKYGKSLEGKKAAAKELGISLTTLYDKLKKYNNKV